MNKLFYTKEEIAEKLTEKIEELKNIGEKINQDLQMVEQIPLEFYIPEFDASKFILSLKKSKNKFAAKDSLEEMRQELSSLIEKDRLFHLKLRQYSDNPDTDISVKSEISKILSEEDVMTSKLLETLSYVKEALRSEEEIVTIPELQRIKSEVTGQEESAVEDLEFESLSEIISYLNSMNLDENIQESYFYLPFSKSNITRSSISVAVNDYFSSYLGYRLVRDDKSKNMRGLIDELKSLKYYLDFLSLQLSRDENLKKTKDKERELSEKQRQSEESFVFSEEEYEEKQGEVSLRLNSFVNKLSNHIIKSIESYRKTEIEYYDKFNGFLSSKIKDPTGLVSDNVSKFDGNVIYNIIRDKSTNADSWTEDSFSYDSKNSSGILHLSEKLKDINRLFEKIKANFNSNKNFILKKHDLYRIDSAISMMDYSSDSYGPSKKYISYSFRSEIAEEIHSYLKKQNEKDESVNFYENRLDSKVEKYILDSFDIKKNEGISDFNKKVDFIDSEIFSGAINLDFISYRASEQLDEYDWSSLVRRSENSLEYFNIGKDDLEEYIDFLKKIKIHLRKFFSSYNKGNVKVIDELVYRKIMKIKEEKIYLFEAIKRAGVKKIAYIPDFISETDYQLYSENKGKNIIELDLKDYSVSGSFAGFFSKKLLKFVNYIDELIFTIEEVCIKKSDFNSEVTDRVFKLSKNIDRIRKILRSLKFENANSRYSGFYDFAARISNIFGTEKLDVTYLSEGESKGVIKSLMGIGSVIHSAKNDSMNLDSIFDMSFGDANLEAVYLGDNDKIMKYIDISSNASNLEEGDNISSMFFEVDSFDKYIKIQKSFVYSKKYYEMAIPQIKNSKLSEDVKVFLINFIDRIGKKSFSEEDRKAFLFLSKETIDERFKSPSEYFTLDIDFKKIIIIDIIARSTKIRVGDIIKNFGDRITSQMIDPANKMYRDSDTQLFEQIKRVSTIKDIDKAFVILKYLEESHNSYYSSKENFYEFIANIIAICSFKSIKGVSKDEGKKDLLSNIVDAKVNIKGVSNISKESLESLSQYGIEVSDKIFKSLETANELSSLSHKIVGSDEHGGIKKLLSEFKYAKSLATISGRQSEFLKKVKGSEKNKNLSSLNMDIIPGILRFRVLNSGDEYILRAGIDTHCCQFLGGAGNLAALDAWGNKNASVLILECKDIPEKYNFMLRSRGKSLSKNDSGFLTISQSYFHFSEKNANISLSENESLDVKSIFILDNIESMLSPHASNISKFKEYFGINYEDCFNMLSEKIQSEYGSPLICGVKYTKFLNSIKKGSMDIDPRNFEYIDNGTYSEVYSDFSKNNFIVFGKNNLNKSARRKCLKKILRAIY